jgi:hypothetical protein
MSKKIFLSLLIILLSPIYSGAIEFNPGLYEITSEIKMPGMPVAIPPQTMTECLTNEDRVPNMDSVGQGCKIKDMKQTKNTIVWKMECTQEGHKVESECRITYHGDTFEGTVKTKMGPETGNMNITTIITGKRIGKCNK